MTTMTDARAVEVLAAMRDDGGVVADADYTAAIDRAVARLREPVGVGWTHDAEQGVQQLTGQGEPAMSTTQEKIAVMQAFDEGKQVQARLSRLFGDDNEWEDASEPSWDWWGSEYRVKPEPRRFWLNVYKDGTTSVHGSKECADKYAGTSRTECIEVVEVLRD